jgi:hypothetical protein
MNDEVIAEMKIVQLEMRLWIMAGLIEAQRRKPLSGE